MPVPVDSVPVLIPVTVKEELSSASVSPYKTSEVPSETVNVELGVVEFVSSSATGASLIPSIVIVKVDVSVSVPSETV